MGSRERGERSMKVLAAALVLCIAAIAYLAHRLVDAGISLDHSRSQTTLLRERAIVALDLLNAGWKERPEYEVEEFAKRVAGHRHIVVKREGSTFILGDIRFELSGGKVESVLYFSDQPPR
jgi:hypothetical protein